MLSKRFKREAAFVVGVVNLAATSALMGWKPWAFWIYHIVKIVGFTTERIISFSKVKKQWYLIDYCYMINYWTLLYYILAITKAVPEASANVIGPVVFRLGFSAITGPLAMSIVAFRNSLVFHSADQLGILAIHWAPSLAVWGMRWFPEELEAAFPGMFHTGCTESDEYTLFYSIDNCAGSFVDLWCWPVVHYIVLWSIPYAIFVFGIAKGYLEDKGYHTVYTDMIENEPMKSLVNKIPFGNNQLRYMLVHGIAICMALFMGIFFWYSFIFHTMYLVMLFLIMAKNGASWYFIVLPKILAKEKAAEEAEAAGAEPGEPVALLEKEKDATT